MNDREGDVAIDAAGSAYFNPLHALDRDLTLGVLQRWCTTQHADTLLHIDPFSGSGVRTQRLCTELGVDALHTIALAGDIGEVEVACTVENVRDTIGACRRLEAPALIAAALAMALEERSPVHRVRPSAYAVRAEASELLAAVEGALRAMPQRPEGQHLALAIDLDPFGSVAAHLDATLAVAAAAAHRGVSSLLCVTTFDTRQLEKRGGGPRWNALGGATWTRPHACWRELSLRMIIGLLARRLPSRQPPRDDTADCPNAPREVSSATLTAVFAASMGFCLRLFVTVDPAGSKCATAAGAAESSGDGGATIGAALWCAACGERSWIAEARGRSTDIPSCPLCGAVADVGCVARPIWRGPRGAGWAPLCAPEMLRALAMGAHGKRRGALRHLVTELVTEAAALIGGAAIPPLVRAGVPAPSAAAAGAVSASAPAARVRGAVPLAWSLN